MAQILLLIRAIGMLAAAIVLGGLAYFAYRSSTAGTGDVLIAIILALLALFALLSIPTRKIETELSRRPRFQLGEMGRRSPMSFRFERRGGLADTAAPPSVQFAEPEVHRIDSAMLEEAKRRSAEGASIDEICRMIDPEHDRHDALHQQVFRQVVRAAIEQG